MGSKLLNSMHYFINIGSNLGVKRLNLTRAIREIEKRYGYFELSKSIDTPAWGFESPHYFMNIGMMFISDDEPTTVLRALQEIEKKLNPEPHRNPDGSYRDRVVDIDIVAIDEMQIDTPELKVPHPHLAERDFFLRPMAELAPLWHNPVNGLTPDEMLARLPKTESSNDE